MNDKELDEILQKLINGAQHEYKPSTRQRRRTEAKKAIQSLLKQAELRGKINELEQFRTNTGQFELERDYPTPSGQKNWNIDIKTRNKLKEVLDGKIVDRLAELEAEMGEK